MHFITEGNRVWLYNGKVQVGYILYYECNRGLPTLGWSISPEFRNRRLVRYMFEFVKIYFRKPYYCVWIKKDNIPSQKAALGMGFKYLYTNFGVNWYIYAMEQ